MICDNKSQSSDYCSRPNSCNVLYVNTPQTPDTVQHNTCINLMFYSWRLITRYCRDRVSSCNKYAVQQDTHEVILMSKFIQHSLLARHVSDLIGPSSGAFCTSCIRRLWCVVIRVLLDTSSRYKVSSSTNSSTTYQSANTACTKRSWWWTDKVRNMSS